MSFFQGASNITVNGGEMNKISGNYVKIVTKNKDSYNTNTNSTINKDNNTTTTNNVHGTPNNANPPA
ncbi:hypothetical protein M378DRAFT_169198, partial [Amanita muscaria Koide BX008]